MSAANDEITRLGESVARVTTASGVTMEEAAAALRTLGMVDTMKTFESFRKVMKEVEFLGVHEEKQDGDTRPYNRFREVRKAHGYYVSRIRKSVSAKTKKEFKEKLKIESTKCKTRNHFMALLHTAPQRNFARARR